MLPAVVMVRLLIRSQMESFVARLVGLGPAILRMVVFGVVVAAAVEQIVVVVFLAFVTEHMWPN